MPLEPHHKIEEILKRFVKKRREESPADFELHPATRQLLQGEVSRTFIKADAPAKRPFLLVLWPRLAFVGIFTALLAVTVMVLNTPQKSKSTYEVSQRSDQLSPPMRTRREAVDEERLPVEKHTGEKAELAKVKSSPAAIPPSSTQVAALQPEIQTRGGAELLETNRWGKEMSTSRALIASAEKKLDALTDKNLKQSELNESASKAYSGSRVVADSSADAISVPSAPVVGHFYAAAPAALSRKFVQQDSRAKYRQNFLSPASPKILQTFEFTQAGNKIQLTESDGSVYLGEILDTAKDAPAPQTLKSKSGPASEFAFQVFGTNQQLNRVVTIHGNMVAMDENAVADRNLPMKANDGFASGEFKRAAGVVPNGSIQAKVSIGGTNEFQIQASEVEK